MVYGIIALLALLVDQFLKFWTVSNVALNTGIRPLIPGFLTSKTSARPSA